MWEIAKAAMRKANPAARLRALAPASWTTTSTRNQRLTRAECNELAGLMRISAEYLSDRQNSRIRELAARISTTTGPTCRVSSSTRPPHLVYGRAQGSDQPIPEPPREPLLPQREAGDEPPLLPPPVPPNPTMRERIQPTSQTEAQTELSGPVVRVFTRMLPEVRVERHLVRGPYFCLPDRNVVHFREDCWAFRHVNRAKIERRTLCEVCINNGQPQYPTG